MNYNEYKNARDASWRLLIDFNISTLPVKVTKLCRELGIEVKLYTSQNGEGGECKSLNGRYIICLNETDPPERQRFSCAHELGHILLGHIGKYKLLNREPSTSDNPIEQAANVFAARLLAPACVLHEIGVKSPEDIARLCEISMPAARYRFDRLQHLNSRDKFYLSPLERQVRDQFENYISTNKL